MQIISDSLEDESHLHAPLSSRDLRNRHSDLKAENEDSHCLTQSNNAISNKDVEISVTNEVESVDITT